MTKMLRLSDKEGKITVITMLKSQREKAVNMQRRWVIQAAMDGHSREASEGTKTPVGRTKNAFGGCLSMTRPGIRPSRKAG